MTPVLTIPTDEAPRRTTRRRTVPARQSAPAAVVASVPVLNRRTLRCELMALYDQYEADIRCANRIEVESALLADEAADARRDARRRMGLIAELLDSEFPGWESEARPPRRLVASRGTRASAVSSHP